MPSYAGTPAKAFGGAITIFQVKYANGLSPYWFRLQMPGHKRVEGMIANEFKDNPQLYALLRTPVACEDPCNPPQHVVDAVLQIYTEAKNRVLKGQPIVATGSQTFIDACKGYIAELEADAANGLIKADKAERRKAFFERFVYPYQPFAQHVTAIDQGVLSQWQRWRDQYWIAGPGKDLEHIETERNGKPYKRKVTKHERVIPSMSTKNGEWVMLNAAFEWASRQGWIQHNQIPKHQFRKTQVGNKSTNPAFTHEQWATLEQKALEWINEPKLRGDNKRSRQQCWWFARVCRAYGLRVAEAYDLEKRHIVKTSDGYALSIGAIKTKASGKHARTILPIDRYAADMEKLFTEDLPKFYREEFGREWADGDPMWMNRKGEAVNRWNKGFDSLLSFAKMSHDPLGNNYNLTSIRHSAITEWIETTSLSTGIISVWAGTSAAMIDKTYNQAIMRRAHFTQTKPHMEVVSMGKTKVEGGNLGDGDYKLDNELMWQKE